MTTLALPVGGPIGYTSICRQNTITPSTSPSLLQRLMEGFNQTVTFSDYGTSIECLFSSAQDALREGALSPDARAMLIAAVDSAVAFLFNRPHGVEAPDVEIWDSGKIGFEWYVSPTRVVNATIDRNGRLVYSALIGQNRIGGVAFVDGEWPNDLIRAISDIRS